MTTWNGADLYPSTYPNYMGRPNTWGQRYSNILIQQADCILAIGTRLGLQQTGFNWQAFAPNAKLIQIDIDTAELDKPSPRKDITIQCDAIHFLERLSHASANFDSAWLNFCKSVKARLPLVEECNKPKDARFHDPYQFVDDLSSFLPGKTHVVPSSSGSAFTIMMQAYSQKPGTTITTNKGMASMGYGLAGSIGASFSDPQSLTILVEGDGSFSQNLQDLATVVSNSLRIKIFLISNEGYASIRSVQKNYFNGAYIGCDDQTGLAFPDWKLLCQAYGLRSYHLPVDWLDSDSIKDLILDPYPALFIVPLEPDQTFFPKLSSRVTPSGSMETAPLHEMSPPLEPSLNSEVLCYL